LLTTFRSRSKKGARKTIKNCFGNRDNVLEKKTLKVTRLDVGTGELFRSGRGREIKTLSKGREERAVRISQMTWKRGGERGGQDRVSLERVLVKIWGRCEKMENKKLRR